MESLIGKINAGYEIIGEKIVTCGSDINKIVLGYNAQKQEYVTWFYNVSCDDYSGGHYFVDKEAAIEEFEKRV